MRYLFIHPNFPAQFASVALALAKDKKNQVVFLTNRREGMLPGVIKVYYDKARQPGAKTHPYLRSVEDAVLQGQAAYRTAFQLKAKGFVPDVIMGHSGWGPTLYMKDIFPDAKMVSYFEWFYHAHGTDVDFDSSEKCTIDDECRIRTKNMPILLDLYSCECGICPTNYQHRQFPAEFRDKIKVLHDGIDTDYYQPAKNKGLVLPNINLALSAEEEIITYVARGMEPYRGFPQFMEAVEILLQRRPKCHVVIVGADRVAYGKAAPNGKTYKALMLEKLELDLSRVHFTGLLPAPLYRQVLQASSAHVYLTRPFVLSWSMLEAMSAGCVLVASNTQPVMEVLEDGVNGLFVDFFSPGKIADCVAEVLDNPEGMAVIRQKARETILEKYALKNILPLKIAMLNS